MTRYASILKKKKKKKQLLLISFQYTVDVYWFLQEELESKGSLPLDCTALLADTALSTAIPDLADIIRNQPETTLNQMALALHTVSILHLCRAILIHSQ